MTRLGAAYGAQPQQGSLFYGDDTTIGNGTRVLNAHTPWSDSVVYWDCAGFNAGQRISISVPDPAKWRGQWNHYVFTKGGGALQIWLYGALLITGASSPGMGLIRSLFLGYAPWGRMGEKWTTSRCGIARTRRRKSARSRRARRR